MTKNILTFKSNLPTLTVIQLHSQDTDAITTAIRNKVKQAPMMFIGMQVILDISTLSDDELTLAVGELKQFLQGEGLNLVAVMTHRQHHRQYAVDKGIGAITMMTINSEHQSIKKNVTPIPQTAQQPSVSEIAMPTEKVATVSAEPRKTQEHSQATAVLTDSQVISHPVRSGQRIYARGDLTIIGGVSPGAEVIADGHIHVYGTLRGRAIAGAQGNEGACIFCQQLDAELVSIAGNYKPNEEIDDNYRQKSVQISLSGNKICFLTL